jgi:CDP-glycerol glycerophosphotransferase (TagB/SpsB family)
VKNRFVQRENILKVLLLLPGWLVFALSRLAIRDDKLVAFGVHTRSFSGNSKALFLADDDDFSKVFISSDRALVEKLQREGFRAFTKFSIKGAYHCLKAGTYLYSGFPSDINFWLSNGARYVNVWHGTPLKKIERDISTGPYSKKNKHPRLFRLLAPYLLTTPDAVLVSSAYEEKCFKTAFGLKDSLFVRAFPPRLEACLDDVVRQEAPHKVLYVPTWRDDHSFRFDDYVDLTSFNDFLQRNEIEYLIKRHPSDKGQFIGDDWTHISILEQDSDIYDFLVDAAILVSDYSSMIFEGLYISKPVALFCPDYEIYQENSREFYIDPFRDLPVLISCNQAGLEEHILALLKDMKISEERCRPFRPYPPQKHLLARLVEKSHSQP